MMLAMCMGGCGLCVFCIRVKKKKKKIYHVIFLFPYLTTLFAYFLAFTILIQRLFKRFHNLSYVMFLE